MKTSKLEKLIFMSLCCDIGLFAKTLINPIANIITDNLHIPGGISTGFSLIFLVIAVELVPVRGAGALMGIVQGLLALILGRVGSMGFFMPIAYIIPGVAIDLVYTAFRRETGIQIERMVIANMCASFAAALTANILVFRLPSVALLLYLSVAASSGILFGLLGTSLANRLNTVIKYK